MRSIMVAVVAVAATIAAKGELASDWLPLSVSTAKGTIDVPAGETKYVRTLDLRDEPVVKTGAGTLAVYTATGSRKIRVEGGDVVFLPPLAASGEAELVDGRASHLDASFAGSLVYAEGSAVDVTGWKPTNEGLNGAGGVTSSAGTSSDGNPVAVTDARGMTWVSFENSSWMYLKEHPQDDSKPVGNNRYMELFAVVKKHAGADHNPAVFGTYNQWNRYCPAGTTTIMRGSPYGASDNNHEAYLKFAEADWSLNGTWVDPLVDTYGEGVQVIRVTLSSKNYFNAIGRDNTVSKGGFMVGEIVAYSQALTEAQRIENERYLLKKWAGVEHPLYAAAPSRVLPVVEYADGVAPEFEATGAVSVSGLVLASSSFTKSGGGSLALGVLPATVTSLTVEDGSLSVNAYAHRPSAEVVSAMDLLRVCARFDASDLGTLTFTNGTGVARMLDADGRADMDAVPFVDSFVPTLTFDAQNGLPVMDMGLKNVDPYKAAFMKLPAQKNVKSFYMVYKRYEGQYTSIAGSGLNTADTQWGTGKEDSIIVTNANNIQYAKMTIDKIEVANEAGGYPEGMHVFGLRNKTYDWAEWGLRTFAGNIGGGGGGMYICEMLAGEVNTIGKDDSCAAIENYLYDKWIAPKHASFNALRVGASASLSLSGNLTLPDGAALTVGLGTDGQVGAVSVSGELTLGASGTVTLVPAGDFRKIQPGLYPLVTAGALASDTAENLGNWTLNASAVTDRDFRLVAIDGTVYLEALSSGFAITVR